MFASTLVISTFAGLAMALMGLSYRWGQKRRITPQVILAGASAAGTVYFGGRALALGQLSNLPARVIFWGSLAGAGQIAAVYLLGAALKRGSFGLVWCALTLSFIPVAFFSILFIHEAPSPWQWVSIVLAIASVGVASMERQGVAAEAARPGEGATQSKEGGGALFGVMLILLMFSAGLTNIGIKDLGLPHPAAGPFLPEYAEAFLFLLYAILLVGILGRGVFTRRPLPNLRNAAGPILTASAGSLLALGLLMCAGTAPSVTIFVVSSILSVMGGFIGAAIFFKDPLTLRSWIVISLGMLSVVCMAF